MYLSELRDSMGQQSQSGQSEFGGKQLSAGEERSPLCVSAGVFLERTRSFPSNATSATRSHVSVAKWSLMVVVVDILMAFVF